MSVIIPTYNRREYVQEAIDSVLAQTYTDYEIIVIDDGSTDGTGEALRERYGDRIRYVWQENAGRSAARNRGLTMARGDFLAFLDDDDLYLPGKLSNQVGFLEANADVSLVAGGVQFIDAEGHQTGVWRAWEDQPELTLERCVTSCPLTTCGVMLRHGALQCLDKWFDPALDRAEDTDFFLRLMLSRCQMVWVQSVVAAYRLHSASSHCDATGYAQAYATLYGHLLSRDDLPRAIAERKTAIMAWRCVDVASRYYAVGDVEQGRHWLTEALSFMPDSRHRATLVEQVLRYSEDRLVRVDEHTYRRTVLNNLPPLLGTSAIRRRALARVEMSRVFAAASRADWETVRAHWWQGVRQDPTWLRNRGVWVIGVKGMLARSRPSLAEHAQDVGS